jgi:hypothetical protein
MQMITIQANDGSSVMNERGIIVTPEYDRRATRLAQMTDTPALHDGRVAVPQDAPITGLRLQGQRVVPAVLRLDITAVTPRIHCTIDLTVQRSVAEKSHLSLEGVHLH